MANRVRLRQKPAVDLELNSWWVWWSRLEPTGILWPMVRRLGDFGESEDMGEARRANSWPT